METVILALAAACAFVGWACIKVGADADHRCDIQE